MTDVSPERKETQLENEAFKQLYDNAEEMVKAQALTTSNIINVVVNLMIIAERFSHMTGLQKKGYVIQVLRLVVEKNVTDSKEEILMFIDNVLPSLIDTMISLDRKEVQIKVQGCLSWVKEKMCSSGCCN